MGQTFEDLLDQLIDVRDNRKYRSDPEAQQARLDSLESIVQTMLEMLADRFEK